MAYAKKSVVGMLFSGDVSGMVVGAVTCVFFMTVGTGEFLTALALSSDGTEVMGRVTRCWEGKPDCNPDLVPSCGENCRVGYTYEVNGQIYYNTNTTDRVTHNSLENEALIKVRYLPDNPAASRTTFDRETVEFGFEGIVPMLLALFFGWVFLTGVWSVWSRLREARSSVRLREFGDERGALVLEREVPEEGPGYVSWRDDSGMIGKSLGQAVDRLPEAGARITVYADPAGKVPAAWEGDVGTR